MVKTVSTQNMHAAVESIAGEDRSGMLSKGLEINNSCFAGDKCSGSTWIMEFYPGFQLIIGSVRPKDNLAFHVREQSDQLAVAVCISGHMQADFQDMNHPLEAIGGRNSLCFSPKNMRSMVYRGGMTSTCITVRIDTVLLGKNFAMDIGHVNCEQKRLLNVDRANLFPLTPFMRQAVKEILGCPYEGKLKRVYLECKATELLIHQLAQEDTAAQGRRKKAPLSSGDRKRIREAHDLLIGNLSAYLPIDELSRKVGLNREKLCRGFRELYGKPIFAYFDEYRLDEAKKHLSAREMNITEIAYDLGFAHPGSFTRAFRRRFGISPSAYDRRSRATY